MVFAGVQMLFSSLFVVEYHIVRRVRRWLRLMHMASMRKAILRNCSKANKPKMLRDVKRKTSELPLVSSGSLVSVHAGMA